MISISINCMRTYFNRGKNNFMDGFQSFNQLKIWKEHVYNRMFLFISPWNYTPNKVIFCLNFQ